ncbi:MAG: hypothetical protein LBI10_02545 [Deltaproteobacteria bacterium]|jgi:predicted RNA-binding Zn-ribbon protein involved in translation (DUF1610 family)|nr:hypothetical protein [Deltaproteobacteria bacterium]
MNAERVIYGREGDELFCPNCGEGLERTPEKDKNHESADLAPVLIRTILTTVLAYKCPKCGKYHYGDAPAEVFEAGLTGFSLMSMIVLFKVVVNATMRKVQTLLQAAFGHNLSLGFLSEISDKKPNSFSAGTNGI